MKRPWLLLRSIHASLLLALPGALRAQEDSLSPAKMTREEFEQSLVYTSGQIRLGDGLATLEVPPTFRFLDPAGSKRLLEDGWGNPAGSSEGVLGMIVPAELSPLSDEGWAVVVTYDEDGYVEDKEAASTDYDKLLREMQEATREENKEREKQGYQPVLLIGWAEPPTYDSASHKLFWAKELQFGDQDTRTLNYNVRILGRRGVLVLNAVANMELLPQIRSQMPAVMGFVNFGDGHRYTDYVAGTDKVAAYGIAGLVAGAMATKAGFLKVLLAGLLAAKKVIIVAAAGAVGYLKRLLTSRKASPQGGGAASA